MTMTDGKPSETAAAGGTAIEVTGLRKSFGDHVVLNGIDLSVPAGSVFALLGPNGAGKTTMVRILATLSAADAGEVQIGGYDIVREPMAVRSVIGVTGQFSATDAYLSAEENLRLMADLWHLTKQQGRERSAELLGLFDLADTGSKPVFTFSGGMQRRLDLAMTLIGSPRIIFLDEPTAGLDPRGRPDDVGPHPQPRTRTRRSRSSSPRSTWRRPTSWPTWSPCSTTARSSLRALRLS